ncbi:TonB-dependent receptor [Mucilaginibacter paludis]|uniref:TonB-dependent receptor n=1 Tax=Mucilaginibacter paludis DSM 18603 TaxID=714943 RepID=H1YFW6_9SPHI|nr:TonB-dependent receptor [Mucilaginibacter paludis]EHQ25357.1 TonB-dependent receptor [Mucilaginibacter paludis DSM 18603]
MQGRFTKTLLPVIFLLQYSMARSQLRGDTTSLDTNRHLNEVTVSGYLSERPLLNIPTSVSVLSAQQLSLQPGNSLVTALNTVPGVRMEERSPGSYRLAIRGSLLRSPFGVRDVKIYFDELPLTDAGGNTYLNAIDVNTIRGIEILKGPDGSLFGANSGGVVLIKPADKHTDADVITAAVNSGSFGLIHENVSLQNQSGNNLLHISQAYQDYGGYRQNSGMHRNYLQLVNQFNYSPTNSVKAVAFYSDLDYQTPGGLTLTQLQADPKAARLGTKTIPGATDLKAAIYSKMLFGGLVNDIHLSSRLRNVLTLSGNHVDFSNPSFTTYEQRDENTIGLRTYFELSGTPKKAFNWKLNLGGEWQQTNSAIGNYGNNRGAKDTTQTRDEIHTTQNFIFTRFEAHVAEKLQVEAALSLNNYQYQFKNLYPLAQTSFIKRPFSTELMPRLAFSYQLTNDFIWRASLSRGYSTPTTGEVRPTDHTINPSLQAQDGYNYETGFRLRNKDERFLLDASIFYYRLNNAIVQLTHEDGTTYYTNAGGTNQPGLELYFTGWLIQQNSTGLIRGLQLNQSYTYSQFTFRDYQDATKNYTGNNLTGVPKQAIVTSVYLLLPKSFYLFTQYSFTDKLPLNDANTVYASSYHLLEAKLGWRHLLKGKTQIEIYAGADNLLNQNYSLGNDLNAAGGRYYNPAPLRNYFGGVGLRY